MSGLRAHQRGLDEAAVQRLAAAEDLAALLADAVAARPACRPPRGG